MGVGASYERGTPVHHGRGANGVVLGERALSYEECGVARPDGPSGP